jgi:hypothetical protein
MESDKIIEYDDGRRLVFRRYVPPGFSGKPKTVLNALRRIEATLMDEERWLKGAWYKIARPQEDWNNPFCDDWKACLAGIAQAVTYGAHRYENRVESYYNEQTQRYEYQVIPYASNNRQWNLDEVYVPGESSDPDFHLYTEVLAALVEAATQVATQKRNEDAPDADKWSTMWADVPEFNDWAGITRTDVNAVVHQAIINAA